MKKTAAKVLILACALLPVLAGVALAQEDGEHEGGGLLHWLLSMSPVLFALVILLLIFVWSAKRTRGYQDHMQRAQSHLDISEQQMIRLEGKMDRMTELLDSIEMNTRG